MDWLLYPIGNKYAMVSTKDCPTDDKCGYTLGLNSNNEAIVESVDSPKTFTI